MDPGSVPAELQGLTQTDEMLIARCCPIMRVLHLKGGQLGYGGHVVNVAQDITTFAATLPRLSSRCTTKSIATKESYRLSSTCGAPRNHTNVPPVDAHV